MNWITSLLKYGYGSYLRWLLPLGLVAYIGLSYASLFSFVSIDVSNSHSSFFKIYWTTPESPSWSEEQSSGVYVNSKKNRHLFPLPVPLSEIKEIRIDPNARKGMTSYIRSIEIFSLGASQPFRLNNKDSFSQLQPNLDVEQLSIDNRRLVFRSGGNDPFFTIDIPQLANQARTATLGILAIFLAMMVVSLRRYFVLAAENLRWVPIALTGVTCLIISMATISVYSVHPDEASHTRSAIYYKTHLSPPQVCHKDTLSTYTIYGVSRLNNREIAYYLGGRYLQAVSFVPGPDYLKLRYLNVFLFFTLTLLAFGKASFRWFTLPLLLTPQVWYTFSYYNSDALSIFVAYLTAYQIFIRDSMLRRMLRTQYKPVLLGIGGIALLVAMQFWVKLNFFFYPLFLSFLVILWLILKRDLSSLRTPLPVLLAVLMGTTLFLSWTTWQHSVNNYSLSEKIFECRKSTADVIYNPSTPIDKTHPKFNLKEKGASYFSILNNDNWYKQILYSSLGAYGFTEYLNDIRHYHAASWSLIILLAFTLGSIIIYGSRYSRLTALGFLGACAGLIIALAYNNWTQDYQPQGRYLLVLLPMLGTVLGLNKKLISQQWLCALSLIPICLGVFSYVFIGMLEISKLQ